MARKTEKRKGTASTKPTGEPAMPLTLHDIEEFFPDKATKPEDKNKELSKLLLGTLYPHHVIRIERIEIGSRKGWRVVYRLD